MSVEAGMKPRDGCALTSAKGVGVSGRRYGWRRRRAGARKRGSDWVGASRLSFFLLRGICYVDRRY